MTRTIAQFAPLTVDGAVGFDCEAHKAHLENHFPALVIFHGEMPLGKAAQCHLFVPEAENRTRTCILLFGQVVVDQDVDILGKIYPNKPQKIKLNNEVGMDWVRRNFENFPTVVEPNLSK